MLSLSLFLFFLSRAENLNRIDILSSSVMDHIVGISLFAVSYALDLGEMT